MTVAQMAAELQAILTYQPEHADTELSIIVDVAGCIGGYPIMEIKGVDVGFDHNAGKVALIPKNQLFTKPKKTKTK